METVQVNSKPDVYRIPVSTSMFKATNCYVMLSGGDALVVDTGMPYPGSEGEPSTADFLTGELEKLGVFERNVRFFLTHQHIDHVGLLGDIAPAGSTVYVGRAERDAVEYERGDEGVAFVSKRLVQMGATQDMVGSYIHQALAVQRPYLKGDYNYIYLEDDAVVQVGDQLLRVLVTPGHAAGHLCLFDESADFVFTGDQVLFNVSPNLDINHSADSDCWQDNHDSLLRLESLGCDRGFAGHGSSKGSLAGRIDYLIDHREEREQEVVDMLLRHPESSAVKITKHVHWNIPAESWKQINPAQLGFMLSEIVSLLDHLEKTGMVQTVIDDKGIVRYSASHPAEKTIA